MGSSFDTWNPKQDVLKFGTCKRAEQWDVQSPENVYSHLMMLATEKGIYYETDGVYRRLLLDDGSSCKCILENVWVWENKYYDKFMVVSHNPTGNVYLIDYRGILYLLPTTKKRSVKSDALDIRAGCYWVGEVQVLFRTNDEQNVFDQATQRVNNALFNKQFNSFVRKNARNECGYLYLTAGSSKCGAFVSYFSAQGMEYEIVPNILCDDDTINVRIPLSADNAARKDVQFLCAKYSNMFSIYGLPYNVVGGGFRFPEKHRQKQYDLRFSRPKEKEKMVYSVVNTLRSVCGTEDDYEVFKKTISKVIRLFERGNDWPETNIFKDVLLLHPDNIDFGIGDVKKNAEYIVELITQYATDNRKRVSDLKSNLFSNSRWFNDKIEGITKQYVGNETAEHLNFDILYLETDLTYGTTRETYDRSLYMIAYAEARKRYKMLMQQYEAETLRNMTEHGYKISRWKNESNLFSIVAKEYPDAIYQYHCSWLGHQSLDIYIPSVNLGIEYQGEQHYCAVEFFGGQEAFEKLVQRDIKKAALCESNGVKLCYWRYDEVISQNQLKKKIDEALANSPA